MGQPVNDYLKSLSDKDLKGLLESGMFQDLKLPELLEKVNEEIQDRATQINSLNSNKNKKNNMKTAKFRGLSIYKKEWVYGFVAQSIPEVSDTYIMPLEIYNAYENEDDGQWILKFEHYEQVDPKTVGQFSGLKDSTGKEIYSGDVVYLAGYGLYEVEFPFIELYQAAAENDIGEIKGNIHLHPELLTK